MDSGIIASLSSACVTPLNRHARCRKYRSFCANVGPKSEQPSDQVKHTHLKRLSQFGSEAFLLCCLPPLTSRSFCSRSDAALSEYFPKPGLWPRRLVAEPDLKGSASDQVQETNTHSVPKAALFISSSGRPPHLSYVPSRHFECN